MAIPFAVYIIVFVIMMLVGMYVALKVHSGKDKKRIRED